MANNRGLGQKLWRVFLLQAALISLAAILGVYAARFILGDVLIKQALRDEADFFWQQYAQNERFPRPRTHNLSGYLSSIDRDAPQVFEDLAPGFHEIQRPAFGFMMIYVTEKDGETLKLVFDGEHVGQLAVFFGLIPLAGVLIVLYLSSYIAYRVSTRAVSPILKLASNIQQLDPSRDDLAAVVRDSLPSDPDQEIAILSDALLGLSERLEAFVLRERNFTRDTSHELRTPITVIKMAVDMLTAESRLGEAELTAVHRIKRSATDMEELIEALLLLARESESALSADPVSVNDIVREECERARIVYPDKDIELHLRADETLIINASDKVLSVLIGNIVRNAWSYTDKGDISIEINGATLLIKDSGRGIPDSEVENVFKPFNRAGNKRRGGYGVGLTIVKMLTDRFDWPIAIDSQLNQGTAISIDFKKSVKS